MTIELQEIQCTHECRLWMSCEHAKRGPNKVWGSMYSPDKKGECTAFILRSELNCTDIPPRKQRTRNFSPRNKQEYAKMGWDPMVKRHIVDGRDINEES